MSETSPRQGTDLPLRWIPSRGFNYDGYRRAYIGEREVAWIYQGGTDFTYWWGGPLQGRQKKGMGTASCQHSAYKKVLTKLASVWT